ncbi:amino acid permease [Saxibacter everestensis]|uniref:Amino acid permease n=1 Tax=Saxibacter everestensis TaxID=2909229 RepID=A0ABY8QUE2_9MICO|nr:amino acid permease [Brevibacteriaceae bacterium ZFBP1038]
MAIDSSPPKGETKQGTSGTLGTGLKSRHVTMISIAGVIGAGLFVGSSKAIALAGPAVLIAYLTAGLLVVLVMRMLGEMAAANPDSGSFSTYADRSIGRWAGFSIGWLYWWFWVLVIPLEAVAAAIILNSWIPAVATWIWALGITLILTITNLVSVGNYGEFEFWFALLKVVAIIGFIVIAGLAVLGLLPGSNVSGAEHLVSDGGFFPNGFGAVPAALLTTMFTFMGTEIVTIAAAESANPAKEIRKATNSVIWRISLFYVASIFLVVSLVPWNSEVLAANGSFQSALDAIGIPNAKIIIDIVILVAVASCLNSALYTASRMMFSLAQRGDAPKSIAKVSKNGVPTNAVLLSTVVGFIAVGFNFLAPEAVFSTLLATSGAVALLVYLVIAVSQLRLRAKTEAAGTEMPIKMWAFPVLTWLVIIFIPVVLIYMAIGSDLKLELYATAILAVVVVAIGLIVQRLNKGKHGEVVKEAEVTSGH